MITPIVVYYIAREFFSQKTSLLASVITALYTSYIAYAGKMMTENLFLPELALIILFVLRLRRDFSFKNSALLGLMLGLSSLTRGTTTPMLLLAPLWFLLFARRIFRERLQKVAVMWGVIILILSPWVIRNYVHFHKVFITSASGGMVMWMSYRWVPIGNLYQIERAYAYVDSVGRKNAKPEIFHQILVEDNIFGLRGVLEALKAYYPEETFPDNEVEFNHMVMEKVRQELFLKPKVLILKTVTEFVRFWHFLDDRAQYVFSYGVILPFFFAGLWLLRRKLWEMGLLLAFFIYIWGIETVFMAAPRYRLPFEIVMIVFSSYTLWELFRRLKLKIIGALIMAVVLGGNLYLKYNVAGFRQFIRQTAIGLGMPVSDKNFQYAPHLNNADSIKQIKQ
jgi:4-amino-4-deoxy-L-arabinose transferase-like glycosyltransferase